MMPLLAGPIRHVRASNFPRRRVPALVIFFAGYFLIWSFCGVPIMIAVLMRHLAQSPPSVAVGLLAAIIALWQASPLRQMCFNNCHQRPPLRATGIRAWLDVFRYGATQGVWCCGTCWALMMVPLTASSGHIPAMVIVAAYVSADRLDKPRRVEWRRPFPSAIFRLVWYTLNVQLRRRYELQTA